MLAKRENAADLIVRFEGSPFGDFPPVPMPIHAPVINLPRRPPMVFDGTRPAPPGWNPEPVLTGDTAAAIPLVEHAEQKANESEIDKLRAENKLLNAALNRVGNWPSANKGRVSSLEDVRAFVRRELRAIKAR